MNNRLRLKYSTELNQFKRVYRDLERTYSIINPKGIIERKIVQTQTNWVKNNLHVLENVIAGCELPSAKKRSERLNNEFTNIMKDRINVDDEIEVTRTKIQDIKSQILRVDNELRRVPIAEIRPNLTNEINALENQLERKQQKLSRLKFRGKHLKIIISNLLLIRKKFEYAHERLVKYLHDNEVKMNEITDEFALAFYKGTANCRKMDYLRQQSIKNRTDDLMDMRYLIRVANTNDMNVEFIKTKAYPIDLNIFAVPRRGARLQHYNKLKSLGEEQLSLVNTYKNDISPDVLTRKQWEAFSNFQYSMSMTEQTATVQEHIDEVQLRTTDARECSEMREKKADVLKELQGNLKETINKSKDTIKVEQKLNENIQKYFDNIKNLYVKLHCKELIDNQELESVNENNLDKVLGVIEKNLRRIMYLVYCHTSKDDKKNIVSDIEFSKPPEVIQPQIVSPCVECSQVEAAADPEIVELSPFKHQLIDKIKDNIDKRNIVSKMHSIEDCAKPGSRSLLAKQF